jgi:transcriptional regulator with AAA-type ATPase domain
MLDTLARLRGVEHPNLLGVLHAERTPNGVAVAVPLCDSGHSLQDLERARRWSGSGSERASGLFVSVNLGVIPPSLFAATLYGYENGAFTGTDRRRLGKFELAEGGTVVLDQIDRLDPSAQGSLLRVLQEREIERLGAAETLPVDVRVIATTSEDLIAQVRARRFREDL